MHVSGTEEDATPHSSQVQGIAKALERLLRLSAKWVANEWTRNKSSQVKKSSAERPSTATDQENPSD